MPAKRLTKSSYNKKVSGVCGGIAEYLDVDPTLVRAGVAIGTLVTGVFPGLIVYGIISAIMPKD